MEKGGYVYILASRRNGTLYPGVTADLGKRVWEHEQGIASTFTCQYGVTILVWYERFDDIQSAITREKRIKEWQRAWKIRLIKAANPEWRDLLPTLLGAEPGESLAR